MVVCLFQTPPCYAVAPMGEIIQKMQKTYDGIRNFKAGFLQETYIRSAKRTFIEEGAVFFRKPQNILWDYRKPQIKKMILNNQNAWLYLPKEKIAYTQNAAKILQSQVLIKFFSGSGNFKEDFIVKYSQFHPVDDEGNYQLVLTPRQKNMDFNEIKVTLDKNQFTILKFTFDDALGNTTTLKFFNVTVNTDIPRTMFRFNPPPGVEVFPMN
jgi:outer membrane lipoprotein carrier protein